MVQVIRYDASGGVTAPEPTHLDTLFAGDLGALIHAKFAAVPAERMDAALRGLLGRCSHRLSPQPTSLKAGTRRPARSE